MAMDHAMHKCSCCDRPFLAVGWQQDLCEACAALSPSDRVQIRDALAIFKQDVRGKQARVANAGIEASLRHAVATSTGRDWRCKACGVDALGPAGPPDYCVPCEAKSPADRVLVYMKRVGDLAFGVETATGDAAQCHDCHLAVSGLLGQYRDGCDKHARARTPLDPELWRQAYGATSPQMEAKDETIRTLRRELLVARGNTHENLSRAVHAEDLLRRARPMLADLVPKFSDAEALVKAIDEMRETGPLFTHQVNTTQVKPQGIDRVLSGPFVVESDGEKSSPTMEGIARGKPMVSHPPRHAYEGMRYRHADMFPRIPETDIYSYHCSQCDATAWTLDGLPEFCPGRAK